MFLSAVVENAEQPVFQFHLVFQLVLFGLRTRQGFLSQFVCQHAVTMP